MRNDTDKTKRDEAIQERRREKSPQNQGQKVELEKSIAPPSERVMRDEAELERRRLHSPQNQGSKIKVNPHPYPAVQTERNKRDEEELERRRRDSPQHQGAKIKVNTLRSEYERKGDQEKPRKR